MALRQLTWCRSGDREALRTNSVYCLRNYSGKEHVNLGIGENISMEVARLIGRPTGWEGAYRFVDIPEWRDAPHGRERLRDISWVSPIPLGEHVSMTYDSYLAVPTTEESTG